MTSKSFTIIPIDYSLQTYQRSNQDTSILHKPVVKEGDWVQSGDLLSDCSSSVQGEFSIGQNILIAYLPWEGYNYEDAILISERLVYDDLYTSIHIERYGISTEKTPYGNEKITKEIFMLKDTVELNHLDQNGIAELGSWLKEGDILVGKITPTEPKKEVARYVQLYNDILGKKANDPFRDSSLRVPRGLEAKVIKVQTFPTFSTKIHICQPFPVLFPSFFTDLSRLEKNRKSTVKKPGKSTEKRSGKKYVVKDRKKVGKKKGRTKEAYRSSDSSKNFRPSFETIFVYGKKSIKKVKKKLGKGEKKKGKFIGMANSKNKKFIRYGIKKKLEKTTRGCFLSVSPFFKKLRSFNNSKSKKRFSQPTNEKLISSVHIYLAEKRKVQVGDKMAGRHGNKGIISQVLPRQDMPYLPDGSPIDMALNPLGVPSRMNVGQIYECLLGLAGKYLGEQYRIKPFDESFGPEASRSFVFSKLQTAKKITGQSWLFQPNNPGKLKLFDGRTGTIFDQAITTGYSYIIKLVHLVDEKIHCLTPDHEVLTTAGWVAISDVKTSHLVATLQKNCKLVYENPIQLYHYSDFKGKLYQIQNANLDLLVTLEHRMLVKKGKKGQPCEGYDLIPAKDIIGKHKKYLKTAFWNNTDYQFSLPSVIRPKTNEVLVPEKGRGKSEDWLQFFGLWVGYGWVSENRQTGFDSSSFLNNVEIEYSVKISRFKDIVNQILEKVLPSLGYCYQISDTQICINDKQLASYLKSLSLEGELNPKKIIGQKRLPNWVWKLSQKQARILLLAMVAVDSKTSLSYYTSSEGLADDVTRLALHAGWSGNKYLYKCKKKRLKIVKKRPVKTTQGTNKVGFASFPGLFFNRVWKISIIQKDNFLDFFYSSVNDSQEKMKKQPSPQYTNNFVSDKEVERVIDYDGEVYCLSVPNEVFYVRRNGLSVWTGNSRSTGPYSLITQQPLKGRSKNGGQRLGEMEVWAIEAYGAAFTLLELLTIKSDDVTGRLTIWDYVLYKKPLYIGTPASFKVMVCELQALCLDIGIYKADNLNSLKQINVSSMG